MKNAKVIKELRLNEIVLMLEKNMFFNSFVGKFALTPEALMTWADTSQIKVSFENIDNWEAFEKGTFYLDENDFISLIGSHNDLKLVGNMILISDETIKTDCGYQFDIRNFVDFVQFYEEKFNESFFQPHDYIIYFPSVLLIKIIHHDGQLISLRNS